MLSLSGGNVSQVVQSLIFKDMNNKFAKIKTPKQLLLSSTVVADAAFYQFKDYTLNQKVSTDPGFN